MKQKLFYIIFATLISTLLFTACRKDEYETPYMTLTLSRSTNMYFYLRGSGELTINWNDRTPLEIFMLGSTGAIATNRTYSTPPPHVISITGDNITYFGCSSHYVTGLDVSNNKKLTELHCYNNGLTRLELSRNMALANLSCSSNQLTHLDVSRNTELTSLSCGWNQLTHLDVSRNTELTTLHCSGNQLTSLDVSRNTELNTLDCSNNQLTRLDVSRNNTALTTLGLYDNKLQANALNTLFNSLPVVSSGVIWIGGNPGTETCNRSIAADKGWRVRDYY